MLNVYDDDDKRTDERRYLEEKTTTTKQKSTHNFMNIWYDDGKKSEDQKEVCLVRQGSYWFWANNNLVGAWNVYLKGNIWHLHSLL